MNFGLGEVLSITTGRLLCDIGSVYRILNHMTGDILYTHQLPRAMTECAPFLRAQFPAIAAETGDDITRENYREWLAAAIERHGDTFDVAPLPEHAHEFIDPMSELAERVHPDKIIVVSASNDGGAP